MTEYFEDLTVDVTKRYGGYTLETKEITEFGVKYDPQPYHTSEELALATRHNGLIASAIQLLGVAKRMTVNGRWRDVETIAGLGYDDIRMEKPVRPGETLFVEDTISSKRRSESNPERGIVHREDRLIGEDDEQRMAWQMAVLVECRTDSTE